MNTSGVGQSRATNPDYCPAFWAMSLWLLLVLPLFLLATEAGAAKITFEPNELSATVAPGEVVMVPVGVSLTETTAASSYASFSVTSVDGNLDPAWINSQLYVSLDSLNTNRQVLFQLNVPADAKGGNYNRVFRTLWVRSNEQITPAELVINVEVTETLACSQVPLFSDITSAEETINARKHKEVAIELSGTVSAPEGCDIFSLWYQLTDEYGELDQDKVFLEISEDGAFSVAVPMIASRKGKDKDGRLYSVKFMADNEAGVGESAVTSVVVLHDKRKKRHHDSKKRHGKKKKKS